MHGKFPKKIILIIQTKKVKFTNVEFPHITPPPPKNTKKKKFAEKSTNIIELL